MSEAYQYGEKQKIIFDLCQRNPEWTSIDLMKATGWPYSEVRGACRGVGIKPPGVLKPVPIDRGIPIPKVARGIGKEFKYPWPQMEIGDSFLFPSHVSYSTAVGNAAKSGERLEMKFAVRWTLAGLRCWR